MESASATSSTTLMSLLKSTHHLSVICVNLNSGCLQLLEILEISWNLNAPGRFPCQLNYDNMQITEPNLVTSLNPRNCHLTIFCAVLFIMSYITESACVCIP